MNLIFCFILSLLPMLHSANVGKYNMYKNYKVYKIEGTPHAVMETIEVLKKQDKNLVYDISSNSTDVLVSPDMSVVVEKFSKMSGLRTDILVDDYSEIILQERRPTRRIFGQQFSWHQYYDVKDIYTYLRTMSKQYQNWTQLVVGGRSYEGRKLLGLRINTSKGKKVKPVIFIESGIHAREWIAPATTTYFINQLLTSTDPKIMDLRESFDWHIFPSVNPDGYQYSRDHERFWRKTRSKSPNGCYGADPNRNWDYNWMKYGASSDPCDYQIYGGAKPFSEIETRSLSRYVSGLNNLKAYVSYHSDAQLLLLPYSDSKKHISNYNDLISIGKTSIDYGYKVNNVKYSGPGTAADTLCYDVVPTMATSTFDICSMSNSDFASGGSMDWARQKLNVPIVFTYELRGEGFSWPPERIPEQGDEVTQMMLGLVTGARKLGYF